MSSRPLPASHANGERLVTDVRTSAFMLTLWSMKAPWDSACFLWRSLSAPLSTGDNATDIVELLEHSMITSASN